MKHRKVQIVNFSFKYIISGQACYFNEIYEQFQAVPSTFAWENMDVLTTTQNLFTRLRTCRCFGISSLGPFNLWMSRIVKRLFANK